jgi:hypothetical protein
MVAVTARERNAKNKGNRVSMEICNRNEDLAKVNRICASLCPNQSVILF